MRKIMVMLLAFVTIFNISAQDLRELYKKVNPSVVVIKTVESVSQGVGNPRQKTSMEGLGTGVLISEDGLILTAAHVVNTADKIWVEFLDGQNIEATVVYMALAADVATVKLVSRPENPVVAKLGDSDQVEIGQQIFVIGTPLGLSHSLSSGLISGRHHQNRLTSNMSYSEFFQTDAAINQGNSGGPVFSMDGEVIGIASSILTQSGGFEGIGFAATSNIAKNLLIERKQMWYGFQPMMLTDELASIFNIPQEAGMLILSVTKNSPAYYMGLKGGYLNISIGGEELLVGGDIILALEGIPITSMENLEKISDHMISLPSGSKYTFKVLRAGEVIEIQWVKE